MDEEKLTEEPLAEARAAGLLVTDPLRFCHPLARSAVYHLARPAERRTAHAALGLAAVEPDRKAWHLAAAAEAPDEHVASALEAAAESARRRGGVAAEAKALLRAAELSSDPEKRALRMLKGALAAEAAGWTEQAESALEEVARTTTDTNLRARAASRRSYLLADRGEFERAYSIASDEAEHLLPEQVAHVLAGGAFMAVSHGLDIPATVALAERATQLAGSASSADIDLCEMLSRAYVLAGRVGEARSLVGAAIAGVDPGSVVAIDLATDLMYLEDYPHARNVLEHVVGVARTYDAPGNLSYGLDQLAKLETRIGNLATAYELELEALELVETRVAQAASLAWLALIEALLGRAESEEHALEALGIAEETEDEFNVVRARAALGVGALARGKASDAVEWFAPAVRKVTDGGIGLPNFFRLDGDFIEALTRLGRVEEGRAHLSRLDDQAASTDSPWALATAARCHAFAAPETEMRERFAVALELNDREPSPFERARTHLCFGERLRRARQRRDARVQLRSALEIFERMDAQPWADRARNEIRATGERVSRRDATAVEGLTPQEFQIAALVAEGITNREVAGRLYLSPKTVEFHLSHVYRKLHVRSRGELIRLLAARPVEIEQYLA
jgi:DNA-binding CsgD family transcriptional regulator